MNVKFEKKKILNRKKSTTFFCFLDLMVHIMHGLVDIFMYICGIITFTTLNALFYIYMITQGVISDNVNKIFFVSFLKEIVKDKFLHECSTEMLNLILMKARFLLKSQI